MSSFVELIKTFGRDGKEFERLSKWILETHPLYKDKLRHVWLWDQWPGKWGQDLGIDLVAEDMEGRNWAIQSKNYNSKYYITKDDVNSFLTESINKNIHHRLLISTTDRIGANALSTIKRQNEVVPISQLMLSDLEQAPLNWPKSLDQLTTGGLKESFKPKPYQRVAINKVIRNLDTRGQLIMACGTGKTLIGLWIYEKFDADTALVLFPSLLLLSKTLSEWKSHSKEEFSFLPVCSDESVSRSEDSIGLSTSDLSFPSTTDPKKIINFLKQPGKKVIFSTYQSSEKIADAFENSNLKPIDLVIADEAHRCAGKVDSAYSTILDDDQIPAKKRLFMTATPKIYTSNLKKQADQAGLQIYSMDDEKVFGPEIHKLPFSEAIKPADGSSPLLTDYQVIVVGVDNSNYLSMIDKRTLVKTENDIKSDAKSFASHVSLAKVLKDYNLRRVISFHSRIAAAKDFSSRLPEVIDWMTSKSKPSGNIKTGFVAGDMPTYERNRNLSSLGEVKRNQRYVLSNARCLSEGVDVPALDGIAFIDPKNSEIDIIQAVGRAIRLSKDKKIGTIMIPVFIQKDDDPDKVLNSSEFKKVWSVINALRSHDELLGEQLEELRYELGKRGSVGKADKIIIDLPSSISNKFEESLKIKLVESTTESWHFWFAKLEEYKEHHGDCLVPAKYMTPSKHNLGAWVNTVRGSKDSLDKKKIDQLESIGFIWNQLDYQWEIGLNELIGYKKKFDDFIVSQEYIAESNYNLGRWVSKQRTKYAKGKLEENRLNKLDQIGFTWDIDEYLWERAFEELQKYKQKYGDTFVPLSYKSKFKYGLKNWATFQRRAYKQGKLEKVKIKKLKEIGFEWEDNRLDEAWEISFNEILKYKREFGELPTQIYEKQNKNISKGWSSKQRQRYKKGLLEKDRLDRLNAMGFIWDIEEDIWERAFEEIIIYKEKFDDCLVPASYVSESGFNLGIWTNGTRSGRKSLNSDKKKKLDSLGFIWDVLNHQWEEAYKELLKYKDIYGDCLVPVSYITESEFKLGQWVVGQRSNKRNDKLDKTRIQKLESINFIWNPDDEAWEKAYSELLKYKEEFGDCLVPRSFKTQSGLNLGGWVLSTRQKYKKGELKKARLNKLNKIGFTWVVTRNDEAWEKAYSELLKYKKKFGDCFVTQSYQTDSGYNLGRWVSKQRGIFRKGKLLKERIARLESIGFVWTIT